MYDTCSTLQGGRSPPRAFGGPGPSSRVFFGFWSSSYGWLSKLGSLFGYPKNWCRIKIGTPKRDHNFDNHPYGYYKGLGFRVQSSSYGYYKGLGFRVQSSAYGYYEGLGFRVQSSAYGYYEGLGFRVQSSSYYKALGFRVQSSSYGYVLYGYYMG